MTADQPTGEPIPIPCEGSGSPTHFPGNIGGMCMMCGAWVPVGRDGVADEHDRDDLIARIVRGDFG